MDTVTEEKKTASPAETPASTETAIAPRTPEGGPPATTGKTPVRMGLAPKTLDEGYRLAQAIAQTEMVPKQYRGKPMDVLVAIQYGMELGFPPMQALQSIAVINGRPSVWGDGFLALIIGCEPYREHDEYFLVGGERREYVTTKDLADDNTTAISTFWRKDRQNPITGTFSIGQAKKANLLGKEGPWQGYPDRMLKMRARGFAGRDGFADILRGVKTTEELLDTPDDDLPAIPEHKIIEPRRASTAAAPTASDSPAATASPQASSAPAGPTGNPPAVGADTADLPAPNMQEIRGLLVTNTHFVKPKTGEPYYQVTTKTTTGAEKVFVTRDESIYKEAASFEDTDHALVITFHEAPKADKPDTRLLVIDRLAIYEGAAAGNAAPAGNGGGLFTE